MLLPSSGNSQTRAMSFLWGDGVIPELVVQKLGGRVLCEIRVREDEEVEIAFDAERQGDVQSSRVRLALRQNDTGI